MCVGARIYYTLYICTDGKLNGTTAMLRVVHSAEYPKQNVCTRATTRFCSRYLYIRKHTFLYSFARGFVISVTYKAPKFLFSSWRFRVTLCFELIEFKKTTFNEQHTYKHRWFDTLFIKMSFIKSLPTQNILRNKVFTIKKKNYKPNIT